MSSGDTVIVRSCGSEYIEYLMKLVKAENWDYSVGDHRSQMRIDQTFLLVAIDNNSGEPIGFAGLSKMTPRVYYFHKFVVRRDRRGQGIGRKLWKAIFEKAGENCIALDGVHAMVPWYKKNGLTALSYKTNLYETQLSQEIKLNMGNSSMIKLMRDDDWPSLMEYDRKVYLSLDREQVLRAWFMDGNVKVYIARTESTIVGYGSIHKRDENTFVLRYVYADNRDVFEEILRSMFECLPVGTNLRFWMIDNKPLPVFIKATFNPAETCTRMYSKRIVEVNTDLMWICPDQSI